MGFLNDKAVPVLKVLLARLRFLAVFIIAGLVVGYWEDIKNHVDKWTRPEVPPDSLRAASDVEYYCAMHPNVVKDEPGNCPICGMPLIKRKKGEHIDLPKDVLARVQLSPQRVAMAGVDVTPVEYMQLTRSIDAVGVIDYDQRRLAQLSSRVAGRADRLLLQSVGEQVKKGQVVYSIYSPEAYTAIRDYLLARKRVNDFTANKQTAGGEAQMDSSDLYNASMQRLLLWGLTREQLDKLDAEFDKTGQIPTDLEITSPIDGIVVEKNILEGGYLQVGSTPYTIADLSSVWMQVKVFERDIPLISIGQRAQVTVDSFPGERFAGEITYMDFKLDPQTRTLDARLEMKNPEGKLRPGMFARAALQIPITQQSLGGIPATQPAMVSSSNYADQYQQALKSYLEATKRLAADSDKDVSALLHRSAADLQPLTQDPQLAPVVQKFETAVMATMGKDLAGLRAAFKDVSQSFIEIGKAAKIPADAPAVSVYRCPMAKADWLQPGGTTANPYYGSEMLTCGGPVEPLPRAEKVVAEGHQPPAGRVLAIPRSAVIETGKRNIVYVKSGDGMYDMKQVKLGPAAGEFYPVISGLNESDQVVTRGAFLIDAENRLNPVATTQQVEQ